MKSETLQFVELLTKMDVPFAFALVGVAAAISIATATAIVSRGPSRRAIEMRKVEANEKITIAGADKQLTVIPNGKAGNPDY